VEEEALVMKVVGVHNRPIENNCFDEFVAWCIDRGLDLHYVRWSDYEDVGQDKTVCMMQDPVGRKKAGVLPDDCLNHPRYGNNAVRDIAYPIWREHGINCPSPVRDFNYAELVDEAAYPYLLKDTGKQMGRTFLVKDEARLDWVAFEAKRFDWDKFKVIEFIDAAWSDGLNRLHRFLVCGERVLPVALARTKGWCCKTTNQRSTKWTNNEVESFINEWFGFYLNEASHRRSILATCRSLGIDFALVDATVSEDGKDIVFWEVNPYVNLRRSAVAGKLERWFPMMANYLFETDIPEQPLHPDEIRRVLREFAGYKGFWMKERAK
jgi:hypothetical protein